MQRKFKDLKERFPNVAYIKADVPSKEMISRSKAVITLVSTAGFEALAIGKPVILLGKIYYDSFEGVNYCRTFEEIYDLVRGHKPFNKSGDFVDFLSKLIAMQYTGNPWINPQLYTDENISGIRKAIEQQIDQ
jgi:capsule polysaccharide modification protein KpsS